MRIIYSLFTSRRISEFELDSDSASPNDKSAAITVRVSGEPCVLTICLKFPGRWNLRT